MSWKDPMAEAIAEKQRIARRNMYSEADLIRDEHYQKQYQEQKKFKSLMKICLKEDEEFRKEVAELLK